MDFGMFNLCKFCSSCQWFSFTILSRLSWHQAGVSIVPFVVYFGHRGTDFSHQGCIELWADQRYKDLSTALFDTSTLRGWCYLVRIWIFWWVGCIQSHIGYILWSLRNAYQHGQIMLLVQQFGWWSYEQDCWDSSFQIWASYKRFQLFGLLLKTTWVFGKGLALANLEIWKKNSSLGISSLVVGGKTGIDQSCPFQHACLLDGLGPYSTIHPWQAYKYDFLLSMGFFSE